MNEKELKELAAQYKECILEEDYDRYIMILLKDVERDVRQSCVKKAYDLANEINNMHRK